MKTIDNYLRHAEDCERLAAAALSEDQRQAILRIAETWRMLADERRKIIEQRNRDASSAA